MSRHNLNLECPNHNEQETFSKMFQEKGESFDDFYAKILTQSHKCAFGVDHNKHLLDKIIAGIENVRIRDKLMSEIDLTLNKAIQMCRQSDPENANQKDESTDVTSVVRGFSDLELINDDCLRHIFSYMKILDVVNLAATCRRLQDFATAVWFPKNLESKVEINNNIIKFIAPTQKVSEYKLTPSFRCIGEYVEDLTFGQLKSSCMDTMRSVFDHFKNLSSLTFTYYSASGFKSNDFAKLFTNNAHCLKHLNLSELRFVGDKQSVYELIVEKLPNLETLELILRFEDSLKRYIDLSHLTTLNVYVLEGYNLNSILRTLSNNGVIEDLTLRVYEFEFENRHVTPLVFNKLKSLTLRNPRKMNNFFERMAQAHMPVIKDFTFYGLTKQTPTLVKFIESKRTLSKFYMVINDIRFQVIPFLHKLIDALKVPCTPERAILKVRIPHQSKEQVSKLMIIINNIINYNSNFLIYFFSVFSEEAAK